MLNWRIGFIFEKESMVKSQKIIQRSLKFIFCILIVQLVACSSLLFHPFSQHVRTPDIMGLEYQDVWLLSGDQVNIHGWFLPAQIPLKGSVYFLHGNAENISTHIESVYWLPEQGYQVFLLDYRGFGRSEGEADLPEVFLDIEAGFSWLLEHAENKPIYLLGQSLGASLCIYFAANNQLARENLTGLISDAAFTDYFQITRHVASKFWLTWLIQYPAAWLMSNPYNPVDAIAQLSPVPVLILHSQKDYIIPFQQGKQLYQAAKQPKFFLEIDGLHTQTFAFLKQRHLLLEFLKNPAEFKFANGQENLQSKLQ
jgi:alpha-beta hydrolase superfamily lysophospholipase